MKKAKRLFAVSMAALMAAASLTACGSGNGETQAQGGSESTGEGGQTLPKITDLKLGEDYTDLSADIKILTHKTDVVDTLFADYVKQFNELYPNINITYEAMTNYLEDMTMRLTTDDWGDICMIPTTIEKLEYPEKFVSFGAYDELSETYDMLANQAYQGQAYGMPSMCNVQGIVYNKKVFADAGVAELPKTPDEFLDALQKVKDNTDAIPLYTNYAAVWTMGAWNAYISGSATGDTNFTNMGLTHGLNPFQKHDDMTGPYAVYYTLYEAVARGLTEDDPTTTDWEGSKGMLNNGQIGCMVLGSWAITQMQAGGTNPDDIAYMPFPITVDGQQYVSAGPDYAYGINAKSSYDNQLASMLYVKWLVEESGFAENQGGISCVKGEAYPDTLKDLEGIPLVVDAPPLEGEDDLFVNINTESEIGLNVANEPIQAIVEAAMTGSQALDEIMDEWNQKWTAAQESNGVTPEEYDYIAAVKNAGSAESTDSAE